MLAQRLPGVLPRLDDEAAAEVAALADLRGSFDPAQWGCRPFRAPHHTASAAALVGGGGNPRRRGEIGLAHAGSPCSR
jgi:magnesium chelatase family protein